MVAIASSCHDHPGRQAYRTAGTGKPRRSCQPEWLAWGRARQACACRSSSGRQARMPASNVDHRVIVALLRCATSFSKPPARGGRRGDCAGRNRLRWQTEVIAAPDAPDPKATPPRKLQLLAEYAAAGRSISRTARPTLSRRSATVVPGSGLVRRIEGGFCLVPSAAAGAVLGSVKIPAGLIGGLRKKCRAYPSGTGCRSRIRSESECGWAWRRMWPPPPPAEEVLPDRQAPRRASALPAAGDPLGAGRGNTAADTAAGSRGCPCRALF